MMPKVSTEVEKVARGLSPVSPVGQLVQYSAAEVVGTHTKCGVGVHVGWVWLLLL
jgi:hypothetical protein